MDSNYSLADIKAVTDGDRDDGIFGGNGLIILLFFLLMLGGGFGFGGWGGGAAANGALTRAELQEGFDTQEVVRKLDGLANGICDGFYAQNTTMLNGFAGVTAAVNESRFAAQQGVCEINRNIDAIRYENAQHTCAITTAIHAEGEETRRMIAAQENAWLKDQLEQARCANSNYMQSQYILGQIGRWYSNPPCAGSFNPCGGCAGCNNI